MAPTSFYNAIANEEDYLSALQQSGHQGTLMAPTGQIGTINTSNGPVQIQLNGDTAAGLASAYGTLTDMHHHHHFLVGNETVALMTVRVTSQLAIRAKACWLWEWSVCALLQTSLFTAVRNGMVLG